jgi:Domain of unknown function (DUF1963)
MPQDYKDMEISQAELSEEDDEEYYEKRFRNASIHQLLGYPFFIQDDPRWDVIPDIPSFTVYDGPEYQETRKKRLAIFEKENRN